MEVLYVMLVASFESCRLKIDRVGVVSAWWRALIGAQVIASHERNNADIVRPEVHANFGLAEPDRKQGSQDLPSPIWTPIRTGIDVPAKAQMVG